MQRHRWTGRLTAAALAVLFLSFAAQAQWTWTPQTKRWINIKHLPKETAELQIENARSLMLKGDLKKALQETVKFSSYYADSDLADQNQYLRGEIKLAMGKEVEASKEFQQVVARYPNTTLFEKVIAKQYEIGDQLYALGEKRADQWWRLSRKGPYKKAIQVYSMVINNQPFTDAAAEAQYKVGLCHYVRGEHDQAAFEYKRVIEDYSTSKWVKDASYGLAQCYYDQAQDPQYEQQTSQLAINAIDEFKQKFPNDEKAAKVDEMRGEMRSLIADQRLLSAKFYEKKRDFDAARIYYELLAKDFKETEAGGQAQQWLERNPSKDVSAADRVLKGKHNAS
jgi:outer membrane assembly lipoprotein YfiO